METISQTLDTIIALMRLNAPLVLGLITVLVLIHIVNWLLGYRLNYLGIYPRHLLGIPGILFSPLLHGNFNHLFFNAIPLYMLASFILFYGLPYFIYVTLIIVVLSGTAVWLIGRKALHIGASSLILGYWSYLLINAYNHPSISSVILGIVTLYYFAGMALNLLPTDARSSWEGHICGFLAGIAANYLAPMLVQYTIVLN
ncbi:MAG: rhomboid family intramembrane serine protease [Gammaproteobacteria bacterium]